LTLKQPLIGNPNRDATDPFRGYVYQVYQSTLAWLNLGDNDCLYLECAEDFDVHTNEYVYATQVKDTKSPHTLRTPEVRQAIDNFWSHTENNSDRRVHFRYLATAKITGEQGGVPGCQLPGLELWQEVANGSVDSGPLREFLQNNELKNASLKAFLYTASDDELLERLIQRIEWNFEQKPIKPLLSELRSAIVLPASRQNINAIDAEKQILISVIQHVVGLFATSGEKKLTPSDLFRVIADAGLVTLPRSSFESLLSGSVDKHRSPNQAKRCPIIWVHGTTEDDTYVPRRKVITELDRVVADKSIRTVTTYGIAGHGKTSLIGHWMKSGNAVTTGRFKQAIFWSFYSNRDVEELIIRLIDELDPTAESITTPLTRSQSKRKTHKLSAHEELTPIEKFGRNAKKLPPSLVVLDGVEVLQHRLNEGVNYGRFVDCRLQVLLEEIARLNTPWLVVCTSRFPLTDRVKFDSDRHIELGPLETNEAVDLLGHNGVRGTNLDQINIVDALQGHPLALKLFAASIPRDLTNEPKRHLIAILGPLGTDISFEEKVIRLVNFYSQSIETVQRLLLLTLSIFRSPISLDTIESVTKALAPMSGFDVESVTHVAAHLEKLSTSGIVVCDDITSSISSYSCHPVILDSFRRELLNQPAGVAAIELLRGRPDDFTLEGVSELEPLIIAFEVLLELGDDFAAMQIYKDRFDNGRIFIRQGLPFEAVRVFESLLHDATYNPAQNGTIQKIRQNSAERKYLQPAADFDISLGELRTAKRRLDRALHVNSTHRRSGIYRNMARVNYQEGDLMLASKNALRGVDEVESTAIALYYRIRALACSGEFDEAKETLAQMCEMRHLFEIPDLQILEPMCKLFLAIRTVGAVVDTSAIGELSSSTDHVLDHSRRLDAKLLLCHAKIVLQGQDMSRSLSAIRREAIAGQYRIRQHQSNILLAYSSWYRKGKNDNADLKYINSVSAEENYALIQCECLRILSMSISEETEIKQHQSQFKLISRNIGYTTVETAFPNRQ